MSKDHSRQAQKQVRIKTIAAAAASFIVGIGLLLGSQKMLYSAQKIAKEAAISRPATSAPAYAPASAPAPGNTNSTPASPPMNAQAATLQRMAMMLLLFGLMAIVLGFVCIGWVVVDVRRSRPAWMTQTKYPIMDKKHRGK